MPDQLPPSPHDPEMEFLGEPDDRSEPGSRGRPRRAAVLAGGAAGVLLAAGLGTWGVAQLMSAGSSPASAVPSIAVAYVSIDLDPSATQKIEALRTLKKFPAIAEHLDLGLRDDLRRWVFEQLQEQDSCPEVDYTRDVEPWLGDRMAVAAVPDDDAPLAPLLVVQVDDRDAAALGVAAFQECADDGGPGRREPAGVAFVGDYMLVTEEQDDADALAKAAEAAPLEDDDAFVTWMGRIGDPGVVTAYASADAPRLTAEAAGAGDQLPSLWKDFRGMAAVVRFGDGSVETEVAAAGLPRGVASTESRTGPALADLPDTTAAALTVSLPDGWLQGYLDAIEQVLGSGEPLGDFWAGVEADTGLRLPEDVETLLGDGVGLSVDGSVDLESLAGSMEVPQVPVALRISGDPEEITRVLDALTARLGPDADRVVVETDDRLVVLGLDQVYVDRLVAGGTLGADPSFRSVLPEADRASGALFVNFDAGGWLDALAEGDREAGANLAPLDALGASVWREDDVQHGLLRLTTA